ncbi:unnamed protein product [Coffea canephora]|uniref:Uncharacterized protein n=1 Tax=Coffea canephora TaxID=49390 RepID=A0A068UMU5_COFCA|nr:unnamed protein product [Coffea canephora]
MKRLHVPFEKLFLNKTLNFQTLLSQVILVPAQFKMLPHNSGNQISLNHLIEVEEELTHRSSCQRMVISIIAHRIHGST